MPDVILQPFNGQDIPGLLPWFQNQETLLFWSLNNFSYPLTTEQLTHHLLYANYSGSFRKIFKIMSSASPEIFGHVELDGIDYLNKSAYLARLLVFPEFQGQGIAQATTQAVFGYAFEELMLHKISLNVVDYNDQARYLYEKLGFVLEGHLRDVTLLDSGYCSIYVYSMLESEWQKIRASLL